MQRYMRRIIPILVLLTTLNIMTFGQKSDPGINQCMADAGSPRIKYLKDFRIQLGKAAIPGELRFKARISLWKNTKYRFTLCNSSGSQGQLIFRMTDNTNNIVVSSFDKKTGQTSRYVDYLCLKSGIYQLNYDFAEGQQGSGVGVISLIK